MSGPAARRPPAVAGPAALAGALAGLWLGLFEGARALLERPATGIEVLRFHLRDYFLLLHLPPLACLLLGGGAMLLLGLLGAPLLRRVGSRRARCRANGEGEEGRPAGTGIGGRAGRPGEGAPAASFGEEGRVGGPPLTVPVFLAAAGAILAPWLAQLVPPGVPVVATILDPPVLLQLLVALGLSAAAAAAVAAGASALARRRRLGLAAAWLAGLWAAATLALLGLALASLRPAPLRRWWAAGWLALALLLLLLHLLPARRWLRRGWPAPALALGALLIALQLAGGLVVGGFLPEPGALGALPAGSREMAPPGTGEESTGGPPAPALPPTDSPAAVIPPGTSARAPRPPNIVLVTVDTLRADRCSLYGHERRTTPVLDRFSRRAVVFERALANAPWTLPSMATLFTGRLPTACAMGEGPSRLPASVPTLAGLFAGRGYATAAVATNPWLKPTFGLDRGFGRFLHLEDTGVHELQMRRMAWHRLLAGNRVEGTGFKERIRAPHVTARALEWLADPARLPSPFFLWMHYMDPHEPYSPSPLPPAEGYQGRFIASSGILAQVLPGPRLLPEDLRRLEALYDEEIRSFDRELGRLLALLRRDGLLERTVVVVTADHGEEFLEHGGLGHGQSLHEELLHVPLLVRLPGEDESGRRVGWDQGAQLADVLPTLLALSGGGPPPAGVQGRDLTPLLTGVFPQLAEPFLAEANQGAVDWESLEQGRFKLLLDRSSGRALLFDSDPLTGERREISGTPQAAEVLPLLRHRLEELGRESRRLGEAAAAGSPAGPVEVDPALRESLRALGYVQ